MQSIYQYRGFASCLKQGFKLVLARPWTTTKVKGPWALALSVLIVAFVSMYTKVIVDFYKDALEQSSVVEYYGSLVLALVIIILGVYAVYRYCKGIARVDAPEKKLKKTKVIFRHFWSFSGVALMSLFLAILLSIVPLLPCYIADDAYWSSVFAEVEFNDPVLIPTGGYVLMFVVSVISLGVALLLSLVCPASIMYKYGSLYTIESNKQK